MNSFTAYFMPVVMLPVFLLLANLACARPVSLQSETLRADASCAPRDFCRQRGGTITETGDSNVYVCCYQRTQKCVVSNTRANSSVRVVLPWDVTVKHARNVSARK